MRRQTGIVLAAVAAMLVGWSGLQADDQADKVKAQKEAARANWKRLFPDDEVVHQETSHLLLYGPASMTERRLKAFGAALEGQYGLARKALQFDPKEELWEGKLAVYLFDQRSQFTSFVRGVEKRRPQSDDLGTASVQGSAP